MFKALAGIHKQDRKTYGVKSQQMFQLQPTTKSWQSSINNVINVDKNISTRAAMGSSLNSEHAAPSLEL